jgi:hypothetical protein
MTRRPLLPRLRWWDVCAALACALIVRYLHGADITADDPQAAWFFFVIGFIWSALQTAWQVTSTVISFALRWTLLSLRWAITNLGKGVALGLSRAAIFTAKVVGLVWRGLRYVFTGVFQVLSKAFTSLVSLLHRVLDPVLGFLNRVRGWVLGIYNDWVKPILDAIDIARRIFRILGQLGLDWAAAIDRALGRLQAKISFPFTFVIAKLNEAIGWINKIVTLDGLVQRLTLMRSLIRDVALVDRLWWNSQTVELSPGEIQAHQIKQALAPYENVERDYVHAIESDDGPMAAAAREFWQQWEQDKDLPLGSPRPHET